MKPYYDQDGITLYLGDCREILPGLPVYELLLTDPPYGIGLDMVLEHGTITRSIHDAAEWNQDIPNYECFELMYAHSRKQIIWGANYYGQYIRDVGRMVHDKQLQIEGTALRYSEADIASCSFQKRVTMFRYRWGGNVQGNTINWHNTGPDARVHPTQKPLALMKWCIQQAGDVSVVLDPFAGSGTTLRAAKDLGIKAVGIEISEAYCEVAVERLRQSVMALEVG
jgi:DNA modification methylase